MCLFFLVSSNPALYLAPIIFHLISKPSISCGVQASFICEASLTTCESACLSLSTCSEDVSSFPTAPPRATPPPFPGLPASGAGGSEISAPVQDPQLGEAQHALDCLVLFPLSASQELGESQRHVLILGISFKSQ